MTSCAKRWSPGKVTGIQSAHVICVDGVPWHVRDVRKRLHPGGAADAESLTCDLPDDDDECYMTVLLAYRWCCIQAATDGSRTPVRVVRQRAQEDLGKRAGTDCKECSQYPPPPPILDGVARS